MLISAGSSCSYFYNVQQQTVKAAQTAKEANYYIQAP